MDVSERRKKTPINFFLSLGKGGVQTYCPCFLMSALETTEILPSLARLVAHISSHSTPPTDNPERSNLFFFFYLCLSFCFSLQVLYSATLAAWPPTLQQQQELEASFFFSLGDTLKHWYTNTKITEDRPTIQCPIIAQMSSKASMLSPLNSCRGDFSLRQ